VVANVAGAFPGNSNLDAAMMESRKCPSEDRQFIINGWNDEAHILSIANACNDRNVVCVRRQRNDVVLVAEIQCRRHGIRIGSPHPAAAKPLNGISESSD